MDPIPIQIVLAHLLLDDVTHTCACYEAQQLSSALARSDASQKRRFLGRWAAYRHASSLADVFVVNHEEAPFWDAVAPTLPIYKTHQKILVNMLRPLQMSMFTRVSDAAKSATQSLGGPNAMRIRTMLSSLEEKMWAKTLVRGSAHPMEFEVQQSADPFGPLFRVLPNRNAPTRIVITYYANREYGYGQGDMLAMAIEFSKLFAVGAISYNYLWSPIIHSRHDLLATAERIRNGLLSELNTTGELYRLIQEINYYFVGLPVARLPNSVPVTVEPLRGIVRTLWDARLITGFHHGLDGHVDDMSPKRFKQNHFTDIVLPFARTPPDLRATVFYDAEARQHKHIIPCLPDSLPIVVNNVCPDPEQWEIELGMRLYLRPSPGTAPDTM